MPLPAPAGSTSLSFVVPRDVTLIGAMLFVQAGIVHGLSPLVVRLSNVQADLFTAL